MVSTHKIENKNSRPSLSQSVTWSLTQSDSEGLRTVTGTLTAAHRHSVTDSYTSGHHWHWSQTHCTQSLSVTVSLGLWVWHWVWDSWQSWLEWQQTNPVALSSIRWVCHTVSSPQVSSPQLGLCLWWLHHNFGGFTTKGIGEFTTVTLWLSDAFTLFKVSKQTEQIYT